MRLRCDAGREIRENVDARAALNRTGVVVVRTAERQNEAIASVQGSMPHLATASSLRSWYELAYEGGCVMLTGSCLCGRVRYRAEGPLTAVARCHCVQCRKASGGEFATNGSVPAKSFLIVSGAQLVGAYESTPGNARHFCQGCGSPLFKRSAAQPDVVRLRLGTLDDASDVVRGPECHVFVSERPAWSEICDALPQFERLPGR
jgi:hypothetical protein